MTAFNWREHLQVHSAAELFPLLPEAELRELAADIKANGLLHPITIWRDESEKRWLIDGRNRLDALALLGSLCKSVSEDNEIGGVEVRYLVGDDPYLLALSLNIRRRHLTAVQKRDLIAAVLQRQPTTSDRQIGKLLDADGKTVASFRAKLEDVRKLPHVETRTDTKGRKQPAAKPKKDAKPQSQQPATPKAPINSKDIALESFDAHVLELIRLTTKRSPDRFAKTAVDWSALNTLSNFLWKLTHEHWQREREEITAEASSAQRKAVHAAAHVEGERSIASVSESAKAIPPFVEEREQIADVGDALLPGGPAQTLGSTRKTTRGETQ